jgi:putative solute:sodium symporter small subunit
VLAGSTIFATWAAGLSIGPRAGSADAIYASAGQENIKNPGPARARPENPIVGLFATATAGVDLSLIFARLSFRPWQDEAGPATSRSGSPGQYQQNRGGLMDKSGQAYWRATLKLILGILAVWFLVSFGAGILFADALNGIKLGGYPLGFWFAHQGSMYVFVALIFIYAKMMDNIDRKFDVHED